MDTLLIIIALAALLWLVALLGVSGFHLLAYGATATGAQTNKDLTAFVDAEISQRNSHYLLSEDYRLLGVAGYGSTLTEGNILSPSFNAITKFNFWPLNDSTVSANPPRMDFWTHYPVPLPMNEELQMQVSSTGTDTFTTFMLIGTNDWNRKIPQGLPPIPVFEMRFSCTPTFTVGAWSPLVAPTFEQSLRGGTYAVVGMEMQGTGLIASRIVFPQAYIYKGRRMRPGFLASQTIGDQTVAVGDIGPFFLGQWGQFTTAELPNFECAGIGSTTAACIGLLRLVRLSESINVNYGGATY